MTVLQDAKAVVSNYEQLEALANGLRKSPGGRVEVSTLCGYVDGLMALGLAGAARDFVTVVRADHPQWAAYTTSVLARINAGLPTGVISWASRRRRFQANLEVLAARYPTFARALSDCEMRASRYELHCSRDGNYQLRDTADGNPLDCWRWGLNNHQATAALWKYQSSEPSLVSPAAFDGVGFGWLLMRVLEKTQNCFLNYSPALYVLEPDPLALWILLHLHDLRDALRNPRLRLFVGEEAMQQYRAELETGQCTLPDYYFANPLLPREVLNLVSVAAEIAQRQKETRERFRREIDQFYAKKDQVWWQKRYESALNGGPPLKIVGITSRFTTVLRYSMEELGAAVRAAGHEFYLSTEPEDWSLERDDLALIHKVQPDLLIQISRMRYEYERLPKGIPFLCWDQDYLSGVRSPEAKASLDGLTYVAGHAATEGYHNAGWPARNCIFCHLAAATHRYSNEPVAAELLGRYACDFSYVSNAAQSPEDLARQLGGYWEPQIGGALWRSLAEEVLRGAEVSGDAAHWKARIGAAAEEKKVASPAALDDLALDLIKVMDRRFRHEALGWAAEYCRQTGATLKLYGRGWEANPGFAAFAAGVIEPGLPLRALYQATKINLQLILSGFLHPRSLDGLAAGGFFLTRHSAADDDPDGSAADFYLMARRALDLGIWNFEQLVASEDPVIAGKRERFHVDRVCALQLSDYVCFYVAGELAAAATVFSDMRAITFRTSKQLRTLADSYLRDEDQRLAIQERMGKIVQGRFSYDARVRTFLQRIARGFAQEK